jgi:ribulose-5-phosphate 4-epimerase/fuculose-1-phosphate aldolase
MNNQETGHAIAQSEAEWTLRVDLAAAFRVAYALGWNHGINNHITARIPDQPDQFLMNPLGLGWDEITASNLVRTTLSGTPLSHPQAKLAPAASIFTAACCATIRTQLCPACPPDDRGGDVSLGG